LNGLVGRDCSPLKSGNKGYAIQFVQVMLLTAVAQVEFRVRIEICRLATRLLKSEARRLLSAIGEGG
jgi:hypothetical protein